MDAVLSANPRETRTAWLALALGLLAQFGQVLVFREFLAELHGTELVFGLILACGLAWTALGCAVAGRWPGISSTKTALSWVAGLSAVWGMLLLGQLLMIRWWAAGASALTGVERTPAHIALGVLLLTGPTAFLSGLQFALVLRQRPDVGFGRLYRAESVGAVAGGLLFTFLMAGHGSPFVWASCAGVVGPLAVLAAGLGGTAKVRALLVCAGCVYAALAIHAPDLDRKVAEAVWQKRLPHYVLAEVKETPYARLTVLQKPGAEGTQVALFMDATLAATSERGATVSETRALADLCACLHPEPERVLLLGGTLGRLPRELLNHGVRSLDAVETDPSMLELACTFGMLSNEAGVNRITADGRYFVKGSPASRYDLVIAAPGLPETAMCNRFCTVEFFREVRRILNDRGVLVLLLPAYGAAAEYQGQALTRRSACIWRAMREVFREVRAAPVAGHLLAGGVQPGVVQLSPAVLGARIDARRQARPSVSIAGDEVAIPGRDYFASLFGGVLDVQPTLDGEDRQEWVARLESALAEAPVGSNRDERPLAVAESLSVGLAVSQGGTSWSTVLRWAAPVSLFLVLLATGTLAVFGGQRSRRSAMPGADRLALLLCAAGTGLFGMALEVLLLHAYQNVRGYVYGEIGGLIACFMAGLALGAHAGAMSVARTSEAEPQRTLNHWRRSLLICVSGGVALSLFLPLLIRGMASFPQAGLTAACFWTLMLVVGFVDGFTFPLLAALASPATTGAGRNGSPLESTSRFGGQAYAADLLGAALGAALCGAVWLPAFGLWGSCLAVAGVLALSGVGVGIRPAATSGAPATH